MNPAPAPGDTVSCTFGGRERRGIYITERDGMAVVKLDSGYNIGVDKGSCTFRSHPGPLPGRRHDLPQDRNLPLLSIVSTGGTIASRIDYRTGSVTSQTDADGILTAIPALAGIAQYRTVTLATILSENMTPRIWQALARAVYQEIRHGAEGIIVTHGTDTMASSAAAIAFMVDSPVPIVFVGSQRSADRPSSDNAMNAVCAARAATSGLGEVAVVMHATTSDDVCSVHRATRVRKMHSSRRDAFRSIGIDPIGMVSYPSGEVRLADHAFLRNDREPAISDGLEERCGLLQFYPGMQADLIERFDGCRGLVIAGTGLGHVSTALVPSIRRLVKDGTMVVMTTQCLHGRVCDRVYDTGRDLLSAGVIEGGDMLPEVALVKMMWVLARQTDPATASRLMDTDRAGECNRRSLHGL